MNRFVSFALATVVAASGAASLPTVASAQQFDCACVSPSAGRSTAPVGSILSVRGRVLVSQTAGFGPAAPGTGLSVGSRIMVGARSESQIEVGSCNVTLVANNDVEIARVDGSLCVRVQDPAGEGVRRFGLRQPETFFFSFIGFGALIAVLAHDDDDSVSKE